MESSSFPKEALNKNERVIVLGVGNRDRGDDGAGNQVIDFLEKQLPLDKVPNFRAVWLIDAGNTPEDFTADIVRYKPTKIIIVDAAKMGEKPGSLKKIPVEVIPEKSLSTHNLSLKVLSGIWQKITGTKIEFLGIEPKNMDYTTSLSNEAKRAVQEAAEEILNVLCDSRKSN